MKFTIKLDLKKIDKTRIDKQGYINDNGEAIEKLMYSMDAVPLKEPKVIKEGDTWIMKKTHFLVNTSTKEERENKNKSPILGDVLMFIEKKVDKIDDVDGRAINPADIPF